MRQASLPIPPLQAGDPNSLNRALLAAVRAGHVECVKLIIPGVNPKRLGGDALFCAVDNCQEECLRLLLSASMPISAQEPALLLAIEKGHANVVALMISHDPLLADLNCDVEPPFTANGSFWPRSDQRPRPGRLFTIE